MTRRMIAAGNWKMNLSRDESVELARAVNELSANHGSVDVAIFPTPIWMAPVSDAIGAQSVILGAQDCYIADSGAFTGEISPAALSTLSQAVLAGHSERRHVLGESDELVAQKVQAIVRNNMVAYLCVGETLPEREDGQAQAVVERQLTSGLAEFSAESLDQLVIAYEPVWAIGTGVAATADDAQEMCASIRTWMRGKFGDAGAGVRVLYGGSVTPDNAAELFGREDIDGGLVGGASLKVESFRAIIEAASNASQL